MAWACPVVGGGARSDRPARAPCGLVFKACRRAASRAKSAAERAGRAGRAGRDAAAISGRVAGDGYSAVQATGAASAEAVLESRGGAGDVRAEEHGPHVSLARVRGIGRGREAPPRPTPQDRHHGHISRAAPHHHPASGPAVGRASGPASGPGRVGRAVRPRSRPRSPAPHPAPESAAQSGPGVGRASGRAAGPAGDMAGAAAACRTRLGHRLRRPADLLGGGPPTGRPVADRP